MRDVIKGLFAIVLIAVILALIMPGLILGLQLADTWTRNETQTLLGGVLAICGGSAAIVAVMVGAGAFARLAGWRAPRRAEDVERPPIVITPGQDYPQLPAPPVAPPWGMTGGGYYELLPPPAQDQRFTMTAEAERGGKR